MTKISLWFMWKKGSKSILKNKSKTIPILFLMVISIAFASAMMELATLQMEALDETLELTNFADGFIYFDPLNDTQAENLLNSEINNYFKDYELRMIIPIKYEIDDEIYDGLIIGVDASRKNHINALVGEDKKELDKKEYKNALNYNFANQNGIKKGDKINVIYGSVEDEIEVEAIGYNPEFTGVPLHENVAFFSIKPYPILYVDTLYLSSTILKKPQPIVNQLIYTVDDSDAIDQDEIKDDVEDSLGNYLNDHFTKDEHFYIEAAREDDENDRQIFAIFTIVLLAGSVITIVIVIHKLIGDDLKSVSIFQGLGANKKEIIGSYLIFNMLLSGIAIILGAIVGNLMNIPLRSFIIEALGLPFEPAYEFSYTYSLIIGVIFFIVTILSTYLIVNKTFKMDIQQTLKYETKFLKKRNLIEKAYIKVSKDPHPYTIYNLRRIFGRKTHLIAIFIALSIASSLLMYMFAISDSFSYSLDRKINNVEKWDCVANTWQYENETFLSTSMDSISNIDEYEFGIVDAVFFSKEKSGDFDNGLRLMAFEEDSKMHLLEVEEGDMIDGENEALISPDLKSEYELKIGDEIYIKSIGLDKKYKVKIVGIVNDFSGQTIYLTIDEAQDVLNKTDKVNTLYFTVDKDIDGVANKVLDLTEISLVVKKDTIKEDFEYMMQLVNAIFGVIGVIMTIFGGVLITIVIKSIMEYRIEDYCNMKGVGLLDREIRKTLFYEFLMYFIFSIIMGILLGSLMMQSIMAYYATIMPGIHFHIFLTTFLLLIAIDFGIIFVSYLFNVRKIKRINIADMMRKKTFG